MREKHWVDKSEGLYREVSDDGSKSFLYKTNGLSSECVEIAEHHDDGTTDAYEVDTSWSGIILHGCKGDHK